MEPRTLHYIARACAGDQLTGQAGAMATRVCTDSRQLKEGDLFVALRGERYDGHQFLGEAAGKKAAAALVDRSCLPVPPLDLAVIAVADTRAALGRLAACYRKDFLLPAVAVAGSNGKSTTKELIAAVLRQKIATLWSESSFNNDIGVPVTLLRLERRHEAAVLEIGTNHPGELAPLIAMVQPRLGVITSIGPEHLEFFGDLEGVLREEGTLAEMLPPDGRLFLNIANALAVKLIPRSRAPVVTIGLDGGTDWSVSNFQSGDDGLSFVVKAPQPDFCGRYHVNLLGRHQALNAALALAVGAEMGVTPEQAHRGLAECQPLKMRLQLWEANGVWVLDDCYNANADSVLAALQTLQDLPCAGRRIAVLGDMAELGGQGAFAHADVGRRAAAAGVDQLFTAGPMARLIAGAARLAGLREVHEFADAAGVAEALCQMTIPGDLVLLKASRAVGLERVGEALRLPSKPPVRGQGHGGKRATRNSRLAGNRGARRQATASVAD